MLTRVASVARTSYKNANWSDVLRGGPLLFPDALPVRARSWPDDGFARLLPFGDRSVTVELSSGGASYADAGPDSDAFQRVEMPLSVLLGYLQHAQSAITAGVPVGQTSVYMAQHALFESVPELYADVIDHPSFVHHRGRLVPPVVVASGARGDLYNVNAWIGIFTHTPLHHDPYHNLYLQLFGRKRIVLFPPHLKSKLDMHTEHLLTNTSRIKDVFSADLGDQLIGEAVQAELGSGDALYIPQGWLHTLRGEAGLTGSVNWWFR